MKSLNKFFCIALIAAGSMASADTLWEGVPTALRLQNYTPDNITVWNVPGVSSTCSAYGPALSTDNLSANDKSRLYATIAAAKLGMHSIYIYFSGCEITSFGMDN